MLNVEKILEENKPLIIEWLSKSGNTKALCARLGCSHQTVHRAKKKDTYMSLSNSEREVLSTAALMMKEESGEFARAMELNPTE